MLNELQETLNDQELELTISQEVKEKLAEDGYHPAFGARPLRRIIQDELEDKIADFIIDNGGNSHLQAELENGLIVIKPMR